MEEIDCLTTELTATTCACLNANGDLDMNENLMDCYETNEFRCPACEEILFEPNEITIAAKFLE